MTPDEVNAATLREIAIVLKGAAWRQEQAARLSLHGAWYSAALQRSKRMPSLSQLVRDATPRSSRARQTPREVALNIQSWAAAAGLKIHRRADLVRTDG
jgi:hypothetical protein